MLIPKPSQHRCRAARGKGDRHPGRTVPRVGSTQRIRADAGDSAVVQREDMTGHWRDKSAGYIGIRWNEEGRR